MTNADFIIGARVEERPGREREIEISRPGELNPWRAVLPGRLDQPLTTAALVDYVATRYFREKGYAAAQADWITTLAVVRVAVVRATEVDRSRWVEPPSGVKATGPEN